MSARTGVIVGSALVVWVAGCAPRTRTRPDAVPPPAEGRTSGPEEAARVEVEAPSLPGASRVYPSEDPRNQAPPGSPEAFPLGRSSAETPAPRAGVAPESAPAPVAAPETIAESGGSTVGARPRSDPPEGEVAAPAGYAVQLFASASLATAQERSRALARHFDEPCAVVEEGGVYKVRLGPFADREAAEPVRRRAFDLGFTDAFIVPPRAAPREGGR